MKILGSYELFICHLFDEKGVLNCGNLEKGFCTEGMFMLAPCLNNAKPDVGRSIINVSNFLFSLY